MDFLFSAESWAALLTLTVLEIVLGIDNIVFISILAGKLPAEKRRRGRTLGLALAMGTRILLLLSLTWMMRLTEPLVYHRTAGNFRTRSDYAAGRPVPAVEEHQRNP